MPETQKVSVVIREAQIVTIEGFECLPKVTLDTGASHGNYIGRSVIDKLPNLKLRPCRHSVRLGDGETKLTLHEMVDLDIQLYEDSGRLAEPITTSFYVVDTLGEEAIIGLPDLLGNYFNYLAAVLERAASKKMNLTVMEKALTEFQRLFLDFESELMNRFPRQKILQDLVKKARKKGSAYRLTKQRIEKDHKKREVLTTNTQGVTLSYLMSPKYGCCFADNRVEELLNAMETISSYPLLNPGEIVEPWSKPLEVCPEEVETPDPLSFNEDILHFMEISVEESRKEYFELIPSHVSEGMLKECPKIVDLLKTEKAQETFAPSRWEGMKVKPVELIISGELPDRMTPKARPIRKELYENAKKEYERLRKYFYEDSNSSIASPLVISPKATAPFIRYCGDYREVNKYIKVPQQPIPIVKHALTKAARYKVYVDLDMANSFHQLPLSSEFKDILFVQTPWGLVRPKFLPEGVSPASGLLQHLVREIFADFEDWTIVIFDNFLVLADDYEDAYNKFEKILDRCAEFGIVLKMKKSWIGVDTVTFFGFEVTHGKWKLSDARKKSIEAFPFPIGAKEMQSFLGAALFFHSHIVVASASPSWVLP